MRAVAYLRVSTEVQSVERQDEELKEFAKTKKLTIDKTFEDVISGSKVSIKARKGFTDMQKYLAANPEVKNILVLELSRLGRKNNEIQNVVEEYAQKGINIHIKDLNIKTLKSDGTRSFESEILISLLGVMAANETRLLSSRIVSGKMSRARKNLVFGGKITGYKKSKEGTPEIDENEAPMVRRMFELATKSLGARLISDVIKEEFGREISIGTIGGILRNSFYKGERKYNDLVLSVEPIVSNEIWKLANDNIDKKKKFVSGTNMHVNLVSGKINCLICGNIMHQVVNQTSRANQFRCKNRKCSNAINRPWLYKEIRNVIEQQAKKSKDKNVREQISLDITSIRARIKSDIQLISKLEERRRRTRIMFIEGYQDKTLKEDCDIIIEDVNNNISNLEKGIDVFEKEVKAKEIALNSDIEHFNKDLRVFKTEIIDIIDKVEVWKEFVSIYLSGWRECIIMKPNSTELGWKTRYKNQGKKYITKEERKETEYLSTYNNKDEIEQLDMMIDDAIRTSEGIELEIED